MKRTFVFCLTAALLLSTAHRLPAPISEESQTPFAGAVGKAETHDRETANAFAASKSAGDSKSEPI
jgi:hypothetical protein